MALTSSPLTNGDTWIGEANPTQNHGGATKLFMSSQSGAESDVLLSFPVHLPRSATVLSAELRMTVRGTQWNATATVSVKRITQNWREWKVHWNSRPTTAGTAATKSVTGSRADGAVIAVDVTNIIQSVVNGADYFGLYVGVTGNNQRAIYSGEAANPATQPILVIEYAVATTPPDQLSPGGGRLISVSAPILTWRAGEQTQSYVEIYSDDTLTTLKWSSGWVVSVVQAMQSGYSLANNETVAWRVRVRNDAGIPTDWSEVEEFTRSGKATLTLTNPADTDPTPSTVEETTPPFIFTYTGTQKAVEWLLEVNLAIDPFYVGFSDDNPWRTLYHVGRDDSTDNSWTPPAGLITNEADLYRVTVRVWGDEDREDVAADRSYGEIQREFYYVRTGSVTAPSSLVVTSVGAKAHIVVQRSSAPDRFSLKVDNKIVDETIDPADVIVSGTTYAWDYYGHRPGHTSTYEVDAVVIQSGKRHHSGGNPTQNLTLAYAQSAILVPRLGWVVPVLAGGLTDAVIGTDIEIIDIPGRRDPVKVWTRIGGYEGTIEGILDTDSNYTSIQYRDLLERIQALPPNMELRVSYADQNYPVIIGQITFTALTHQRWNVQIPFFQVDEFTFHT